MWYLNNIKRIQSKEFLDLEGFGVTSLFGSVRTNISLIQAPVSITAIGEGIPSIKFDNNGFISESSERLTGGSIDSILSSGKTWYFRDLYDHLDGTYSKKVTSINTSMFCDSLGSISQKDGVNCVDFLGTGGMYGNAYSELNSGNNFSLFYLASTNSAGSSGLITTRQTSDGGANNRLVAYCSGSSTPNVLNIKASGTAYIGTLDSAQTEGNLILVHIVVDGTTKTAEIFLNGIKQIDTVTFTGTYENLAFGIGEQFSSNLPFDGFFIMGGIHNKKLSYSEVLNIKNNIFNYLNL